MDLWFQYILTIIHFVSVNGKGLIIDDSNLLLQRSSILWILDDVCQLHNLFDFTIQFLYIFSKLSLRFQLRWWALKENRLSQIRKDIDQVLLSIQTLLMASERNSRSLLTWLTITGLLIGVKHVKIGHSLDGHLVNISSKKSISPRWRDNLTLMLIGLYISLFNRLKMILIEHGMFIHHFTEVFLAEFLLSMVVLGHVMRQVLD